MPTLAVGGNAYESQQSDRDPAQHRPRHGSLDHRGVRLHLGRDRRGVGRRMDRAHALQLRRALHVRRGLDRERPAGRPVGPLDHDGDLLRRHGRVGAGHRALQQQVADRRGADPDGRLRLDLPSGRHPDAGAEGQELRLHHRRERAGRQHGHRHRRRRVGLHRPALRLADGLRHPGRDLPGVRRGLRGPGAARGGGAGQAQAEDDRPAAGGDGARVRHHDLHGGDRQHHLQLHDQR